MFEKAARLKLRFNYKGILATEDLWDLNLSALDSIYKGLNAELKNLSEDSLLEEAGAEGSRTRLKLNIVKHVFAVKQSEQNEREAAVEKAEKKKRLLAIMADKQDEQLRDMSVDELKDMIEEL